MRIENMFVGLGSAKEVDLVYGFGIIKNIEKDIMTILILGGAIMGTTVLLSSLFMPSEDNIQMSSTETDRSQILAPQFIGIIVIGYVIMGMGILRAIRRK